LTGNKKNPTLDAMPFQPLARKLDVPEIVQRYGNGESLQTIAEDAQVNRRTLYRWMLTGLGDEQYHALVTNCLAHRIEDADQRLATAITNDERIVQGRDSRDMCRIVQAREMAKFARMDLERRRPALYGMKTGLAIDQQISVTVNRGAKKYVKQGKPVRTPRARQAPVDITPQVRQPSTASASVDNVNPLDNSEMMISPHVERPGSDNP
jgi:hypothetical protein